MGGSVEARSLLSVLLPLLLLAKNFQIRDNLVSQAALPRERSRRCCRARARDGYEIGPEVKAVHSGEGEQGGCHLHASYSEDAKFAPEGWVGAHACNNVIQTLRLKEVPRSQVDGASIDSNAAREDKLVRVFVRGGMDRDERSKTSRPSLGEKSPSEHESALHAATARFLTRGVDVTGWRATSGQ